MEKKLTVRVMFGYGVSALAFNFVWSMASSYVSIYFINVLGIGIGATGVIVLIARIWDGFNDPLMGSIVDNTNTKYGKYRPYLLIGIIPLVITTILLFTNPTMSIKVKTFYAGAIYILFGMSYTLANIPYMSMLSTLTKEPDTRTTLMVVKNLFVMLGVMLPAILVTKLAITQSGYVSSGFTTAAIIGAALLVFAMLITFFSTKNYKYHDDKTNLVKITWKDRMDAVFTNKPLKIMMIAMFVFSLQAVLLGAQTFFVVDGLGRGDLAFTFTLVMLPGMFVAMIAMPLLRKLEKSKVIQIGMAIYFVGSLLFQFSPNDETNLLLIASFIKGIGFGAMGIMIFSMIADCVDYAKYLTGKQQGGIIFSATTFIQKAVSGLGAMGLSGVLLLIKFKPDSVGLQTAQTVAGLKMLNGYLPALLAIAVIFTMRYYPLTKARMIQIQQK